MGVVMYRCVLLPTYSDGWTDNPTLYHITVPPPPNDLHWDIEDKLEVGDG